MLDNPLDSARLQEIYSRTAAFYDQVVAEHGLAGRYRDPLAAAHREDAAAHRAVPLGATRPSPGDDRGLEDGQEIGVPAEDAKRPARILGVQVNHVQHRRRAVQDLERLVSLLLWRDDPQVDHSA